MIGQVWNRLQLLFAQGVASLVTADKVQAQVMDGEVLNNLARVEPYGLSYFPQPGCQSYLLFPSGDRSFGVAIVCGDKRYQMELVAGEVALHDDQGNYVHLKRGGNMAVRAYSEVLIDSPSVKITGSLEVGNGVTITGGLTVNGKDVSDAHKHISAAAGSPTSGVI